VHLAEQGSGLKGAQQQKQRRSTEMQLKGVLVVRRERI